MYVDGSLLVLASAVAIGIVVKHHTNIKRLFSGEENQINFKKKCDTVSTQKNGHNG
jgi:Predicted membrane protein